MEHQIGGIPRARELVGIGENPHILCLKCEERERSSFRLSWYLLYYPLPIPLNVFHEVKESKSVSRSVESRSLRPHAL